MPQVPYNPVPEAQPASGGTPTLQLNKKAAFGENIAAGLDRVADGMTRMASGADALARGQEKLAAGMGEEAAGIEKLGRGQDKVATAQAQFGKALDHAGTEIFGRAIAMQNMVNDADARQATTDYMLRTSDLHANFSALQGRAASDALPKFKEDLVNIRQEIRNSLKNPAAQRLYDAESQGTMSRTMFAGASHAAQGLKQYNIATLEARIGVLQNKPYDNPYDENEFKERQNELIDATYKLGSHKAGVSDPNSDIMALGILKATSEQRLNQILQLVRTDPFKADELFKLHAKELTEPDQRKASDAIITRSVPLMGNNLAQGVLKEFQNPDHTFTKSAAEMEAIVRERAQAMSKDERVEQIAVTQLRTGMNVTGYFRDKEHAAATQSIYEIASRTNTFSLKDLAAMPEAEGPINTLKKYDKNWMVKLDAQLARQNTIVNGPTMDVNYKALRSMAIDKPYEFISANLLEYPMRTTDKKIIENMQRSMAKDPTEGNVMTRTALKWITSERPSTFKALGIDKLDTQAKVEKANMFKGALAEGMDLWRDFHDGKNPNITEVLDQILPAVVAQERTKGAYWGFNQKPITMERVTNTQVKQFQEAAHEAGQLAPDKEQITRRILRARMYEQLFGFTGPKKPEEVLP